MGRPKLFQCGLVQPFAAANRGTALAALEPGSCLMSSEPGEPVFVLCGRDPHAAVALDLWLHERRAALRELEERRRVVNMSVVQADWRGTPEYEQQKGLLAELDEQVKRARQKIHDAAAVAQAFEAWASRPKALQGG